MVHSDPKVGNFDVLYGPTDDEGGARAEFNRLRVTKPDIYLANPDGNYLDG